MNEESIINSYNEGINAVISLVKGLNNDLSCQMGSLTSEIIILSHEISTLNNEMSNLKKENSQFSNRIADHCECGEKLSEVEDKTRTRQEFEMPEIKPIVTEYITHEKICPRCG